MTTRGRLYVAGLMTLTGVASYAAIIYPMMHASEFREIQEKTRRGLDRTQIQPGGMRIWSDPFTEREKEESEYIQRMKKKE